jgi:hypothetical protein
MSKEQKGELENGKNNKTSKTPERRNTKHQILQNGERQNIESCRTGKEKR